MAKIIVYPRLYTTLGDGTAGTALSAGDAIVDRLYELSRDRANHRENCEFRLQVVDSATRLFGEFDNWILLQRRNPKIVGYNLEFIADTLRFIRTGERNLNHATWFQLLSEGEGPSLSPISSKTDLRSLDLQADEMGVGIYQKWCMKPNGVTDLLQTLFLLFGHSRQASCN